LGEFDKRIDKVIQKAVKTRKDLFIDGWFSSGNRALVGLASLVARNIKIRT
jgi:hypothetical protein